MKTVSKFLIFSLVVFAVLFLSMFFAVKVEAAQNANNPSPSKCNGADWNIGLPDGITCSSTVSSDIGGALQKNPKATSIFGVASRPRPDLTSLNQFCKQYTGDNTSYVSYASVHNYCTGCGQNLSWYNGSTWITNSACAGTLNVQNVLCSTGCNPTNPTYCANGTTMTSAEFNKAKTDGKIVITQTSQTNTTTYHIANTTGCSAPLIASSYKMFIQKPNTGWLSTQEFYADSGIININANGNTDISVSLASCMTQADLWYQTAPHFFTSDNSWVGYLLVFGGPVSSADLCSVNIACSSNSQCGTNGYTGSPFCQGGNVYQNYITYVCNNAGTANSSCSDSTAPKLKTTCSTNQTCSNGQCQDVNITCSSNSQCGTNGYTGSPFCQGNSVYQNYITYTCNNANTSSSYCSNSTTAQLKYNCTGNQTCSNGSCGGTSCSSHSYQQCVGNYLYWYNSCGVQEDGQYCSNGCTNNYCNYQQNYFTVQTNSATNTYNNQTTLNGYIYGITTNNANYVWFQWGPTTSYGYNGYETNHQTINYSGSFSQNISGLIPGAIYHYRAVAQDNSGRIIYGQDMTFQSGQVLGATDVNTGLTNNFLIDSFFLPLMIALAGIWLFRSGILNTGAWVDGRKIKHKDYIANKELMAKISQIKSRENK